MRSVLSKIHLPKRDSFQHSTPELRFRPEIAILHTAFHSPRSVHPNWIDQAQRGLPAGIKAEIMALVANSAKEVFDNICERFQPSRAGTETAMFRFDLAGDLGGQFWAHIANGICEAGEGAPPSTPDITIVAGGEDFIRLVNQQLQPMIALMQGKIKVQGSMGTALKMISWFDLA